MTPALVHCAACSREWHSTTLAEGLRALPDCPRCGGELIFADAAPQAGASGEAAASRAGTAPHLVLGVPRRSD